MNNTSLLSAENIAVRRQDRLILDGANLTLHSGEIVTLIGPNGAGKTTLVRCALGLITPDSGQIVRKPDLRIGYMPQKLHIEPSLPLSVDRFLALAGGNAKQRRSALQLVGVEQLQQRPMQRLSGGETQRVLLARALLREPELLVLDEPVQGVDVAGQAALYQLITRIRDERGCGVLMVSHDLHLVMATTDTVVCLNQHVCCHGHPEKVSAHPAYLELFGEATNPSIAVYTHHHDHEHDIHGDISEDQAVCSHNPSLDLTKTHSGREQNRA